ncbi:type II toxin-antitoxin system RelB family antitoxin [uncultured Dubosiella sp.]|uniref:type II toxin-antitoxin system RelB family antitoxin n=2 Tax=uncultured Dubosiella sp. TaxID=1937011 RepID=UPI0020860DE3|nr:DUF6290 family protein [uncultured Dubosiella sp.]GJM57776.1 hypothetical protein EROP_14690 [Erysipelotrichaceae bacterium OPF54]
MLSIRLSEKTERDLKEIAEFEGLNVSDYVRNLITEKIEDFYDLQAYQDGKKAFEKEPVTYSFEDVGKMLGIR